MEKVFVSDSQSMWELRNFGVQINITPKEGNRIVRNHTGVTGRMPYLCTPPHLAMV